MKSDAALAAENARFSKKRIGSIGSGVLRSQSTKAASSTAPTESAPTISGLDQPWPCPLMIPHVSESRPALASASPARSSALSGP